MARRSVELTRANDASNPLVVDPFGDDSNSLRITQRPVMSDAGTQPVNGRVAVTVNSATTPDPAKTSEDDDTHWLDANGRSSVFEETAPSGPWDVRLVLVDGDGAVVELEEF